MSPRGHTSADAFNSEIGGGQLDEVQNRPEAGSRPAAHPGQVIARRQGRFNRKGGGAALGEVESTKELFGGRGVAAKRKRFELNLVGVQKGNARVEERDHLASERGLASAVGTSNQDCGRIARLGRVLMHGVTLKLKAVTGQV